MKLVAPGRDDDRFIIPTLDAKGNVTTLAIAFPQFLSSGSDMQLEGDAIRLSVLPCMMDHMNDALRKLDMPDPSDHDSRERNRTLILIGEPGIGKTTASQVLRQMTRGKEFLINCYDRDMSELIAETTVDGHHKWETLEQNVNDRIRQKTLKPISMKVVKEQFKDYQNADGTIDFAKISDSDQAEGSRTRMQALEDIAEHEGLISRGGGHLITKVPGPLYYALKAAKESTVPVIITLDEFARRRDAAGGDPKLYEVLAGTRPDPNEEVIIDGGNGERFALSNNDLRRNGSLVVFTGNYMDARDDSIKPLPDALASRLATIGIDRLGERDWAHRVQQLLSGLPVSTLYEAQRDRWEGTGAWEGQPHDFVDYLTVLRKRGMAEGEQKNIPVTHYSFINNWQRFKDGTEQLAQFMSDVAQMENPRSALYDRADNVPAIAALQEEVQRRPKNHPAGQVRFDLRLIQQWIEEAMHDAPPVTEKGRRPARRPGPLLMPEEQFGTRLVNIIHKKIDQLYPERNPHNQHIRNWVEGLMMRHGIFLPDLKPTLTDKVKGALDEQDKLQHGPDVRTSGEAQSVADLLNTPRDIGRDATIKAWQEIIAGYIQQAYPDHFEAGADLKPEYVISYSAVKHMLDNVGADLQKKASAIIEADGGLDLVPSIDIALPQAGARDAQFTLRIVNQQTFDSKNARDILSRLPDEVSASLDETWQRMAKGGRQNRNAADPSTMRLLMTLALPGASGQIIPKLFPKVEAIPMLPMQMAAGQPNDANLGISTVQVGIDEQGKPDALQVLVRYRLSGSVVDGKPERLIDKVVLIGNGPPVPSKLAQYLSKAANVTYISRKQDRVQDRIHAEVDEMVRYGEHCRRQAIQERVEADSKLQPLRDEDRAARIVAEMTKQMRGPTLAEQLQTALQYSVCYTDDYLATMSESLPELKDIPAPQLKIAAPDIIAKSKKLSLTDMLANGDVMFEPDRPVMLMQQNLDAALMPAQFQTRATR
jgi:hypothetical protein